MKGSRYRSPTSIERDEGINRELAIGVRSPPFHPKGLWSPAARPIRNSLVLSSWWSGDICGEERAHHTSSASKTGASIWKFGKLRPVTAEEGGLVLVLIRPRPWFGLSVGPRPGCSSSAPTGLPATLWAPASRSDPPPTSKGQHTDTAGIQAEMRDLYRRQWLAAWQSRVWGDREEVGSGVQISTYSALQLWNMWINDAMARWGGFSAPAPIIERKKVP